MKICLKENIGTMIICPNCHKEMQSPIGFGSKSDLKISIIERNYTRCPNCGKEIMFSKKDMRHLPE